MNDFPPPPPGGQPPAGGQPPYEPPTQPMQPAQPGQPGQPQQQYAQPPQQDPYAELDSKRKKQLGILSAVAAVLIVAAFFGGKAVEKKNYEEGKDGYNEIYNAGAASGTAAGTKAGKEQGQKEGQQQGEAEGTEKGKQEGVAEGTADGANQALGNFSSWNTSTPYVILMGTGSGDVPYSISSRTLMQPDTFYKICASGQGVCTEPDNGNSGGGSTGNSP